MRTTRLMIPVTKWEGYEVTEAGDEIDRLQRRVTALEEAMGEVWDQVRQGVYAMADNRGPAEDRLARIRLAVEKVRR